MRSRSTWGATVTERVAEPRRAPNPRAGAGFALGSRAVDASLVSARESIPGDDECRLTGGPSASERGERSYSEEANAAFERWRGQAINLMLGLFGFSVLPPIAAWVTGYNLPTRPSWIAFAAVILLLAVAGLVMRGWPATVRIWLLLVVAYLASLHGIIWYSGAMARVWLFGAPLLALILSGPRSAAVATLLSVGLIAFHAFAALTGVAEGWRVPGFEATDPAVIVARSVMWLAFFVPVLYLIYSVHRFHLRNLAEQSAISARLAAEVEAGRKVHAALARVAAARERLEREIARVGDDERRRIGQDLHDGVQQQLVSALLRCTALERCLARHSAPAAADARSVVASLESVMNEVHEATRDLSPVGMHPETLGPALRRLARSAAQSFGLPCDFRESGKVSLADDEKITHLYRIAQEAVNNAGKHAQAGRITVDLAAVDGQLCLTVEDDGRGIPEPLPTGGLGLEIMAFRAQRIGGWLSVQQRPEGGTRVMCQLPQGHGT